MLTHDQPLLLHRKHWGAAPPIGCTPVGLYEIIRDRRLKQLGHMVRTSPEMECSISQIESD